MRHTESLVSVVVGVDGSSSSVHAAEWAVDEAVSRGIPLRLVHVIQSTANDIRQETTAAEAALRAAQDAINETDQAVKIETVIARGPVAETLVAESVDAAMVCVGSVGTGPRATKYLGATASAVARSAQCQVAIIRNCGGTRWSESGDIAVVIDDSPDVEAVLHVSLAEARLRNATLLVLRVPSQISGPAPDGRLTEWLGRSPDVQVHHLLVPNDIPAFLSERDPPVQLAVMGKERVEAVAQLVGPYGRFVLRDTDCSILLAAG